MSTADSWIRHLNLLPHPEGGFYKEVYRSSAATSDLPAGFEGQRNFSTSIYYLLRSGDRSIFHRIKSDELWHHYDGGTLSIYVLDGRGLTKLLLGKSVEKGEVPQLVIPANTWFAARVETDSSYVLAGCTVSPGFDFADFELAHREELVRQFPSHATLISELT